MQNRNDAVAAAENWIARYVRAWSTNDPDDIRALFTENAEYRDGPATAPWVGREAIVDAWLAQKDEPGTWSFAHELTAVDGDIAVIRGWTDYPTATEKARRYDNLMVIRLAEDGSAAMFTDWWVASQPSDS